MQYFQHIEVKRLSCLSEYEEWFYQADHEYHMHMYSHYKKMLQILLYNYGEKRKTSEMRCQTVNGQLVRDCRNFYCSENNPITSVRVVV